MNDTDKVSEFRDMLDNELALWTPDKPMDLAFELRGGTDQARSRYEMAVRRDQTERVLFGFRRVFGEASDA